MNAYSLNTDQQVTNELFVPMEDREVKSPPTAYQKSDPDMKDALPREPISSIACTNLSGNIPSELADKIKEDLHSVSHIHNMQPFRYDPRNSSVENLEQGVSEALMVLDSLSGIVARFPPGSSEREWFSRIQGIKKKPDSQVIVGVVGATGAGKSSLINAMLDEERLVPTSTVRACTAVVTEISYNHGPDPYRAEIEFISAADWESELRLLCADIDEGTGDVDTDAAIAASKIEAVYSMDLEGMESLSVEELMNRDNVTNILGTTIEITESDASRFYRKIQAFVESGSKRRQSKESSKDMQFWPLIRVVRIYTKAPVLSTGAVLVDLPGLLDSNAARANVAANYIEKCSNLWIVAPITRAVDDKTASTLMSDTFKRQMQMDGGFQNITFVCSKTDDINVTEARELADVSQLADQIREVECNIKSQQREVSKLKGDKRDIQKSINAIQDELETLYDLQDSLNEPAALGKRKKVNDCLPSQEPAPPGDGELPPTPQGEGHINVDPQPPSLDASKAVEVEEKFRELRASQKQLRHRKQASVAELKRQEEYQRKLNEKLETLKEEYGLLCISARNAYSKKYIQQEFAAGIRELDEDDEDIESDAGHNDNIMRDYDEIANSLRVFCVSAKGYQKLTGWLRRDPPVNFFRDVQETEIPNLREHCMDSATAARKECCKQFLNGVSQLLNSLSLQFSEIGSAEEMREQIRTENRVFVAGHLDTLKLELEELVSEVSNQLAGEFDIVFRKFDSAALYAKNTANDIVQDWNRHQRDGGFVYMTYRAICRRSGIYSNGRGSYDWNAELTQLLKGHLGHLWERTFTCNIPGIFDCFAKGVTGRLRQFHANIESRLRDTEGMKNVVRTLTSQTGTYFSSVKQFSDAATVSLSASQRAANREFYPFLKTVMEDAYASCEKMKGKGSMQRMHETMASHVELEKRTMFSNSTGQVKILLEQQKSSVIQKLAKDIDTMIMRVFEDYGAAFEKPSVASEWALRNELSEFLEAVTMFGGTSPGEAEESTLNPVKFE